MPETERLVVGVMASTDSKRFDVMATCCADILARPVRSRHVGSVNFVLQLLQLPG